MQAEFLQDEQKVKAFIEAVSKPRLSKYLSAANGDPFLTLRLYHWNSQLSQALYLPLQSWEISLRNRMNSFLVWKYNQKWFEDPRALRTLTKADNEKLSKTILRQQQNRRTLPNSDQIVADLSAGFWVALLGGKYDIPFAWRYNLSGKIFKNNAVITRQEAFETCGRLLDLRNRVAHHEPIFHLDLGAYRAELSKVLGAMCDATEHYMTSACSFRAIWGNRPQP